MTRKRILILAGLTGGGSAIAAGKVSADDLKNALFFPGARSSSILGRASDEQLAQVYEGLVDDPDSSEHMRALSGGVEEYRRACAAAEGEGRLMWPTPGLEWEQLQLFLRKHGIEVPDDLPGGEYSSTTVRQWIADTDIAVEPI